MPWNLRDIERKIEDFSKMPKGNAKSSSSKPKKCDGRTPGKEHFSSVNIPSKP